MNLDSADGLTRSFDVPSALWQDQAALEALQLDELNRVLARARETPYYAEKLKGAPQRLESLAQLRQLPRTSKAEVLADIAEHPPFGSRTRVPLREIKHVVATSGTSGSGQELYPLDHEDERRLFAMAARGFAWAGVNEESIVLNTLPMTTAAAGQWYYHALRLLGAVVLEVGTYSTERKLDFLRRLRADTLVGTPSYLWRLGVAATEQGLDADQLGVRRLVIAGESWSEAWLGRLEERFGAHVFEQYGSTQRAMAWSCPRGALPDGARGLLHALSDHGVYEVLDPESGEPVTEGPGELVFTSFVSGASPLLRFSTGDQVVLGGPCPCGRPGPHLVAGRAERFDFMVKIRGVNVWPEALDAAIFGVPSVSDYTAEVVRAQDGRELLKVGLELRGDDPQASKAAADQIKRIVGLNAHVHAVEAGAIVGEIPDRFVKRRRLFDRRGQ